MSELTCPKIISLHDLRKLEDAQEHLLNCDHRLNGVADRRTAAVIASARFELGKALCLVSEVTEVALPQRERK